MATAPLATALAAPSMDDRLLAAMKGNPAIANDPKLYASILANVNNPNWKPSTLGNTTMDGLVKSYKSLQAGWAAHDARGPSEDQPAFVPPGQAVAGTKIVPMFTQSQGSGGAMNQFAVVDANGRILTTLQLNNNTFGSSDPHNALNIHKTPQDFAAEALKYGVSPEAMNTLATQLGYSDWNSVDMAKLQSGMGITAPYTPSKVYPTNDRTNGIQPADVNPNMSMAQWGDTYGANSVGNTYISKTGNAAPPSAPTPPPTSGVTPPPTTPTTPTNPFAPAPTFYWGGQGAASGSPQPTTPTTPTAPSQGVPHQQQWDRQYAVTIPNETTPATPTTPQNPAAPNPMQNINWGQLYQDRSAQNQIGAQRLPGYQNYLNNPQVQALRDYRQNNPQQQQTQNWNWGGTRTGWT